MIHFCSTLEVLNDWLEVGSNGGSWAETDTTTFDIVARPW